MPDLERFVIGLAVFAVALGLAVGAIGATGSGVASLQEDTDVADVDNATDSDTETVRHEHPDEYAEEGNTEAVERWLVDRMTDNIDAATALIEDGEYDHATEILEEEYLEQLDQYDEIAGELGTERRAELLEEVREEQLEAANVSQEFDEARSEYEDAIDAGDDERAREQAHELEDLVQTANDSSGELRELYAELEAEADTDLSESDAALERTTDGMQDLQDDVREAEFELTTLQVDPDDDAISFLDPLVADGRLETLSGEAVANEPIRLEIGNETIHTETTSNGLFDLEYRPVDVPLSSDELTIRYAPDNDSAYLGSETTVNVSIEQVEPTVSNLTVPAELAYGDIASVDGTLSVDGVPVDDAPLGVLLENESLGTTDTSDGSFAGTVEVPASVEDGERALAVRLDFDGDERALAATTETTSVTVLETETELSLDVDDDDVENRTVGIDGTLETTDGDSVTNESVALSVDGATLEPVTTGEDGSFDTVVDLDGADAGDLPIGATYDGTSTNLESAQASATVTVPAAGDGQPWSVLPVPAWIGLGLLVLVALSCAWYWRQARARDRLRDRDDRPAVPGPTDGPEPLTDDARTALAQSTFTQALEALSSGAPDEAVQLCYAAVRLRLESRLDRDERTPFTHWEFYDRYRADDDDDRLEDVTRGYEHATFDRAGVSTSDAEDVLDAARRLCGLESDTDMNLESDGTLDLEGMTDADD